MDGTEDPSCEDKRVRIMEGDRSVQFVLPHFDTDHIQRHIASSGSFYEIAMLRHARAHIEPGDLVVDVGAYIGNHTLFFAGICDASVVAFEPRPGSYSQLCKNVEVAGVEHLVTTRNVGVGASQGRASTELRDPANGGSNQLVADHAGPVAVVRLDDEQLSKPPKLIKIDVEGMELDVLRGAEATIRSATPILYVECVDVETLARVTSLLSGWGFAPVAQFNATPTVCFYPASSTTLQTQLAHTTWYADHGFAKMARRLAEVDKANEGLAAQLRSLTLLVELQSRHLTQALAALEEQNTRGLRIDATVMSIADIAQQNMAGLQRTERDLHTMMLRTEAALLDLQQGRARPSHEGRTQAGTKASHTKQVRSTAMRKKMFAGARRKMRKLERDPEAFFNDSSNSFVRERLGPFYLLQIRKMRRK